MNWSNVRWIWLREVRDQLRDRRTIFTIAILPLLLYPLIGMTFVQVTQFVREHPTRVWVLGAQSLPSDPALIVDGQFAKPFCREEDRKLLAVTVGEGDGNHGKNESHQSHSSHDSHRPAESIPTAIRQSQFDAVIYFPPDFADRVAAFRRHLATTADPAAALPAVPQPQIFFNSADDKSRIAADRVGEVLDRWRNAIAQSVLAAKGLPPGATRPFQFEEIDVSEEQTRRAAIWSKILPFVVLIWALTGAFYPAVDLCAGEKERGTLETLLTSPAARIEIVWGKLLTVMSFSIATSLLNLASMGVTGAFIVNQIGQMAEVGRVVDLRPPPLLALFWLVLALIPIAALFSALALAIAAFARSSKEGQYYLMPLLLISLPLMTLPMLPTAELELGTSLIPLTGMMLWLRALIEGQFADAARFALPVVGTTAGCCWLAIRWAVRQFNSESVLFRESERVGLGIWLRHLVRDRQDTPSAAEGFAGGLLLLMLTFFASLRMTPPESWADLVKSALATQIGLIAVPAVIMAMVLTRNPRRTLLLTRPQPAAVVAAALLAISLNPLVMQLGQWIQQLYPMSESMAEALKPILATMHEAPLLYAILLIGLTPAICEELAFRGFILSGLRHLGNRWAAIVISSVFFGLTHGLLQQSLAAAAVGALIGYIAMKTGSLWPGAAFHFVHNSLAVTVSRIDADAMAAMPLLNWFFEASGGAENTFGYRWPLLVVGAAAALPLVLWFHRRPELLSDEEQVQRAMRRGL